MLARAKQRFEADQGKGGEALRFAQEDLELATENCIFCNTRGEKLVVENALAQAVYDTYPVSSGHALIVPRRHAVTIWDLDEAEYAACFALVREARTILEARHGADGFNVGVNCGVVAGQSVMHAHIHLIPRYRGDVPDPRGGIRNVIPHKAHYERKGNRV
jgi:diadenosine tetraphosphate (Ap4A) HIT family hydrolase